MITATALLHILQTKGVRLDIRGDQLAVDTPKGTLTEELREAIRAHKRELITLLRQDGSSASPTAAVGGDAAHEDRFPIGVPPCPKCKGLSYRFSSGRIECRHPGCGYTGMGDGSG